MKGFVKCFFALLTENFSARREAAKSAAAVRFPSGKGYGLFSLRQSSGSFPLAGVKNTWIGVPAIHEDISARIIREGANDVQGHIDFCAVVWAVTFQGVAQGTVPGSNDGGMDLISIDHLPFQMGVMPPGSLRRAFRF